MRPRHYRRAWGSLLASTILLCLAILPTVHADLPFTYTNPQQCTPFNITWTASPDAFPYSLYLVSVLSTVQSFLITKEAGPPNARQVTFQYILPQSTSEFQDFVISLADSKGNGNTSDVLHVTSDKGAPTNCAPYSQSQAFTYSSEPLNWVSSETRPSCAQLHYGIVPQNGSYGGTPPFSFTLLPIGQTPITVNIPSSASRDLASLDYVAPLPFKEGTRFMQFMSDASGGGSGGSSIVYSTVAGSDSSCLAPGYTLPNMNKTNALPLGRLWDGFAVLDGGTTSEDVSANPSSTQATSQSQSQPLSPGQSQLNSLSKSPTSMPVSKEPQSSPTSSSHSNGGLIGGIAGAVAGVAAVLAMIVACMFYRKRRAKKRKFAHDEIPQLVYPDEDQSNTLVDKGKRKREEERLSSIASPLPSDAASSYVSPLMSEVMQFRDVIEGHMARSSLSNEMRLANVGGASVAPHTSASNPTGGLYNQYPADARSASFTDTHRPSREDVAINVPTGTPRDAPRARRSGSGSPDESAFWRSSAAAADGTGDVGTALLPNQERDAEVSSSQDAYYQAQTSQLQRGQDASQGSSMPLAANPQHGSIIQHQDAGPAQSSLDELPPTYGQWIRPQPSTSKDESEQADKQVSEAPATDEGNGVR